MKNQYRFFLIIARKTTILIDKREGIFKEVTL